MLTTMTVLLENNNKQHSPLLDIPRFTIVVMSLFHLLKEVFQIWDEVRPVKDANTNATRANTSTQKGEYVCAFSKNNLQIKWKVNFIVLLAAFGIDTCP